MNVDVGTIIKRILSDVKVDLTEEFDRNFERQGFFSEGWKRSHYPGSSGTTLVKTGNLRRSITSKIDGNSITFVSSSPYASIHNEGGEIKVTERMKKYFWHKYYEARGSWGRKKNGEPRKDKRTLKYTEASAFWKAMALMKVGSAIKIPKRMFIGASAEVENMVKELIERELGKYFESFEIKNK